MILRIVYLILTFIVILLPIKLANYLYNDKKVKINRWILAFISPFIIIVPKLIFPDMPGSVLSILILLFIFSTILFFETTRLFIANKEIKGVINYSTYIEKDNENKKSKR